MKTNFISNLKHNLFLLLALFGTLIGYSQSIQTSTIGGGKTIRTDSTDDLLNIGGSQGVPRDRDGGMIISQSSFTTNCIFGFPETIRGKEPSSTMLNSTSDVSVIIECHDTTFNLAIGGKGSSDHGGKGDIGQVNDDDFDLYDIGGGRNSTGSLGCNDIGGHGTKGTSTTMLGVDDDFFPSDIGGRGGHGGRGTSTGGELAYIIDTGGRNSSGTGTDIGSGQYDDDDTHPYDIGGKSTTGGLGNYAIASPIDGSKTPDFDNGCDIGGRGSVGTGYFDNEPFTEMLVFASLEYTPGLGCDIETGGRTGNGTSTTTDDDSDDDDNYDTGGRGSRGNIGEQSLAYSLHCPDYH